MFYKLCTCIIHSVRVAASKKTNKQNFLKIVFLQILIFLQFVGNNANYHLLRDVRGPSTNTVCTVIHRVAQAISTLEKEVIKWPDDMSKLPGQLFEIAGFPSVAGCIDGCHIQVIPPKKDEPSYVNRHQTHSLNVLAVAGPDLMIYFADANAPGRCHDSRVLKKSSLWQCMEVDKNLPFEGAVLLGDLGYPNREWLLTPFPGDPVGTKSLYNKAHRRTRNLVERAFGVIKKRYFIHKRKRCHF